jgi:hypothetical protein
MADAQLRHDLVLRHDQERRALPCRAKVCRYVVPEVRHFDPAGRQRLFLFRVVQGPILIAGRSVGIAAAPA